ncbi:hypothetical protein [Pseudomonas typographi]|uniref:hypothetical protein n=1 Tax=Pseudomonas typographi TaxID=2715964 RepID=UPI001682AE82|nr:hypothetical protein [Pseudomonas typographi]MBD1554783.1 hypothetical protein [Pseudomonas typographi]
MAAPKKIDYERIEPAWRAGIKSPAQLASEYTEMTGVKVSHAAIIKHFKKLGVPRDLSAKVRAKSDAMVMEAMVTGKVSTVTTKRDAEIIDEGAVAVASVRIGHRTDIGRARRLANKLLDELEALTDEQGSIKSLITQFKEGDHEDGDAMADMLALANKMGALPSRTKTMKELAETLKTLVALERQAYGVDDSSPEEPYEERLARLMGAEA